MSFNLDPSKKAPGSNIKQQNKKQYHPALPFNSNNVSETNSQKHLSVVLDNRLSFEDHFKMILNKVNKAIGIFLKLQNIPLRSALLTIFKTFIRPHLDYGHIVYGQAYNTSLHLKLELLRYNTCLTITGAIRSTSREKLYKELGLKSLQLHSWYRKLTCLYKLFIS